MDDLEILPQPKIVDELTAEDIFQRMLGTLLRTYKEANGKDFTALTESNPAIRLLRSAAEEEAKLRVQENERYRARFVYFSRDENLDTLLREEGLEPAEGESTTRKQQRIIVARTGSSSAGPTEWYQRKAIEVAPDEIEMVSAELIDDRTVRITILAKTPDGIPSADLIDRVKAVVASDDVHADDHETIIVTGPEPVDVTIRARITLEPDTDEAVFHALKDRFNGSFTERRSLGRDIPWSWTNSRLHVPGVHEVENLNSHLPSIQPHQVARLAGLELELNDRREY